MLGTGEVAMPSSYESASTLAVGSEAPAPPMGPSRVVNRTALGSAESKDANLEVWLWLLQGLAS